MQNGRDANGCYCIMRLLKQESSYQLVDSSPNGVRNVHGNKLGPTGWQLKLHGVGARKQTMDYLGDIGAVHLETYAEYDVQSRI
jgi:hypothetical protein